MVSRFRIVNRWKLGIAHGAIEALAVERTHSRSENIASGN